MNMQQKRQYRMTPNLKHNNQEMGTQQKNEFRSMLIIQRSKITYGMKYTTNTKTIRLKQGVQKN